MSNLASIVLPNNVTYEFRDSLAVKNITRNGTTYTVTRTDGTTFTFTQDTSGITLDPSVVTLYQSLGITV